jgi:hypothetical protein
VLLPRGLIPEYGHLCPSPNLLHKLRFALVFTVFGLVAGASGVALLVADESDPQGAFTRAPQRSPRLETTAAPMAGTPALAAFVEQKVAKADRIQSCSRHASDEVGDNCDSSAAQRPRTVHAVTNPPATVEISTDQSSGPPALAPEPVAPVADTPALNASIPESADAALPSLVAAAPAPATSASKPRKTARHQGNRRYSYHDQPFWPFDQHYRRGGNARRAGMLFW